MNLLITNIIGKVNKLEKNLENQTKKQEELEKTIINQVPAQKDSNIEGEVSEKIVAVNSLSSEEFTRLFKEYISKNDTDFITTMNNKLNENYGKKIENCVNLTTTIKQLTEERINKTENKLTDILSKAENTISDLENKYSSLEGLIKDTSDKKDSKKQKNSIILENYDNSLKKINDTIKDILEERDKLLQNINDKIEKNSSDIIKILENQKNFHLNSEFEKQVQEEKDRLTEFEQKFRAITTEMIDNLEKNIFEKINNEKQETSSKLEKLKNVIVNDLTRDYTEKLESEKSEREKILNSFKEFQEKVKEIDKGKLHNDRINDIETSIIEVMNIVQTINVKYPLKIEENEKIVEKINEKLQGSENKIKELEKGLIEKNINESQLFKDLESTLSNKIDMNISEVIQLFESGLGKNFEEMENLKKDINIISTQLESKLDICRNDLKTFIDNEVIKLNKSVKEENERIISSVKQKNDYPYTETRENMNNTNLKKDGDYMIENRIEKKCKELMSNLEQDILFKSMNELEKFKKEEEMKLGKLNDTQGTLLEIIQNIKVSLRNVNNVIDGKESGIYKTIEENTKNYSENMIKLYQRLDLLENNTQTLNKYIDFIKINYTENTKFDEIVSKVDYMRENYINLSSFSEIKSQVDIIKNKCIDSTKFDEVERNIDHIMNNYIESTKFIEVKNHIENINNNYIDYKKFDEIKNQIDYILSSYIDSSKFDQIKNIIDLIKSNYIDSTKFEELETNINQIKENYTEKLKFDEIKTQLNHFKNNYIESSKFVEITAQIDKISSNYINYTIYDELRTEIDYIKNNFIDTTKFDEVKIEIENVKTSYIDSIKFEDIKIQINQMKSSYVNLSKFEEIIAQFDLFKNNYIEFSKFNEVISQIEQIKTNYAEVTKCEETMLTQINFFKNNYIDINKFNEVKTLMEEMKNSYIDLPRFNEVRISVEDIKNNYLEISKFNEIKNDLTKEISKNYDSIQKLNESNESKYKSLSFEIENISKSINDKIEIVTSNVDEISLSINKEIETLTNKMIENSEGLNEEIKEVLDKLFEHKREMTSCLEKENDEIKVKLQVLNKIIVALQNEMKKLEKYSTDSKDQINEKIEFIENKLIATASEVSVSELGKCINAHSEYISIIERNIEIIKEDIQHFNQLTISLKKEVINKVDKTTEENKNFYERELSKNIQKLNNELSNLEIVFNDNLEKSKKEFNNEILEIRVDLKQKFEKNDQSINEIKTKINKRFTGIEKSCSELYEKNSRIELKIELIPLLDEKINSIFESLDQKEKTSQEQMLKIDNESKILEEKISNLGENIGELKNAIQSKAIKQDILENQCNTFTRVIQDLVEKKISMKESIEKVENMINLIVDNLKSLENSSIKRTNDYEKLLQDEKENTLNLLKNYFTKQENQECLVSIKKEFSLVIDNTNNSYEEKYKEISSKLEEFNISIETKLSESKKSVNKINESLILENHRLSNRVYDIEKRLDNNISPELKYISNQLSKLDQNLNELEKTEKNNNSNMNEINKHLEVINLELNKLFSSVDELEKENKNRYEIDKNVNQNLVSIRKSCEMGLKTVENAIEKIEKSLKSLYTDLDHYNKNSTVLESNTRIYIQKEITNLNNQIKQLKANIDNHSDDYKEKYEGVISKYEDLSNKLVKINDIIDSKGSKDEKVFKELEEKLKILETKTKENENIINILDIKTNQTDLTLKNQDNLISSLNSLIDKNQTEIEDKLQNITKIINDLVMKNKEMDEENNKFDLQFLEEFKDVNKQATPSPSFNILPNEKTFSFSDDEEYAFSIKNHLLLKNKCNKLESISKNTQIKNLLMKVESFSLLRYKFILSKLKKYITSQERLENIIINNINSKFFNLDETKNKMDNYFINFNNKVDNISYKIQSMNEYLVLKKGKNESQEISKIHTEVNSINSFLKELRKHLDNHSDQIKSLQSSQKSNEIVEMLKTEVINFDKKIQSVWDTIALLTNDTG